MTPLQVCCLIRVCKLVCTGLFRTEELSCLACCHLRLISNQWIDRFPVFPTSRDSHRRAALRAMCADIGFVIVTRGATLGLGTVISSPAPAFSTFPPVVILTGRSVGTVLLGHHVGMPIFRTRMYTHVYFSFELPYFG